MPKKDEQTSSIELTPESNLSLGGEVSFNVTVEKIKGNEYPMVVIWAYQDDTLVYAELKHPDEIFVLGGGSSDWLNIGGSVECEAYLYSYGGKYRGFQNIRTLAGPVTFIATGEQ